MSLNKKIIGIMKQNEMIYNSLIAKNITIEFEYFCYYYYYYNYYYFYYLKNRSG